MALNNGDKRMDEDILQSKADILRARNVILPPGKGPVASPAAPQPAVKEALESIAEQMKQAIEETPPLPACAPVIDEQNTEPAQPTDAEDSVDAEEEAGPSFNLAEQIMAEQRKISAHRRKGPAAGKTESIEIKASKQPEQTTVRRQYVETASTPRHKVIARIVSRDIERLIQNVAS